MTLNETENETVQPSREAELPDLAVRLVSDVARIVAAEARLLESNIIGAAQSLLDRVYLVSILIVLAAAGVLALLGSAILMLHQWMRWWLVLGLVGAAALIASEGVRRVLTLDAVSRAEDSGDR